MSLFSVESSYFHLALDTKSAASEKLCELTSYSHGLVKSIFWISFVGFIAAGIYCPVVMRISPRFSRSLKKYRHSIHLYPYWYKITWFLFYLKELESYKEEQQTKPAFLAVNKMDLPDAQVKLDELMKQLQNPAGKASFTSVFLGTEEHHRMLGLSWWRG